MDHGRVRRREYETIRVLGTGSKATVKLARRRDGAHVALKAIRKPGAKSGVPDPAADEFAAARREWLTEVRALELVGRHENMPALVEAFETGSKWYIAMEYQRGGVGMSTAAPV